MSQKRKARLLTVSLPPELHAAVKKKAEAGQEGLSAFVARCLANSPALRKAELEALAQTVEEGDTAVSVVMVQKAVERLDRDRNDLEFLLRLRDVLAQFLDAVNRRAAEEAGRIGTIVQEAGE